MFSFRTEYDPEDESTWGLYEIGADAGAYEKFWSTSCEVYIKKYRHAQSKIAVMHLVRRMKDYESDIERLEGELLDMELHGLTVRQIDHKKGQE